MPLPSSVVSSGIWKRSMNSFDLGVGAAADGPEPREQHDLAAVVDRVGQRRRDLAHLRGVRLRRAADEPDVVVVLVGQCVGEVLGDVDVHRARTALEGQVDGLLERRRRCRRCR